MSSHFHSRYLQLCSNSSICNDSKLFSSHLAHYEAFFMKKHKWGIRNKQFVHTRRPIQGLQMTAVKLVKSGSINDVTCSAMQVLKFYVCGRVVKFYTGHEIPGEFIGEVGLLPEAATCWCGSKGNLAGQPALDDLAQWY